MKWLKGDGARVRLGEEVAVTFDTMLHAPGAGFLRIHLSEGGRVVGGQHIATVLPRFVGWQFYCDFEGEPDPGTYDSPLMRQLDDSIYLRPVTKGLQFAESLTRGYEQFDDWGYEVVQVVPLQNGFGGTLSVTQGAVLVGKLKRPPECGVLATEAHAPYEPLPFHPAQVDHLM